jgi:hypothetical protein
MSNANQNRSLLLPNGTKLRKLKPEQLKQIDELLESIGEYGEIHLVIQHGELRYINSVESHKARTEDSNDERLS